MERDYYLKWKAENTTNVPPQTSFEENTRKFLGLEENDSGVYIPKDRQARIEELKRKTAKTFARSDALYNPDKRTVGVFFEATSVEGGNTEETLDVDRKSRASNSIFLPNTYQNDEFKKEIMKTTTQAEHHEGQFIAEPLDKQFNLRRTVISEYSNAKHNQTVFINPRFMSC